MNKRREIISPEIKSKEVTANSFENIYLANVPNRRLDLSIIELEGLGVENKTSPSLNMENKSVVEVKEGQSRGVSANEVTPLTSRKFKQLKEKLDESESLRNGNWKSPEDRERIDIFNYNRDCDSGKKTKPLRYFLCQNQENIGNSSIEDENTSNESTNYSKRHQGLTDKNIKSQDKFQRQSILLDNIRTQNFSNIRENCLPPSKELLERCCSERCSFLKKPLLVDREIQTENGEESTKILDLTKKDLEPGSVKDLLKIIQQQNEQLLLLQKQVTHLMLRNKNAEIDNVESKKLLTENQNDEENDKKLQSFAFGVTTSFEFSIRKQQNKCGRDYVNQEAKITEISENDESDGRDCDESETIESVILDGSIPVREVCPSPEQSVHVDMVDFSSESE